MEGAGPRRTRTEGVVGMVRASAGAKKSPLHLCSGLLGIYAVLVVVGRTRFELVTNGLKVRCSTN